MELFETKINLNEIIFDQTIYPRNEHVPSKVQEYAENIEAIEAAKNFIILSDTLKLLDGRHRHLAYLKNANNQNIVIPVFIRKDIKTDEDAYLESIVYNSSHGQQLSAKDKNHNAIRMYTKGYSFSDIAKRLSITERTVRNATKDIREREKSERKEKSFQMYLACYTQEEIAESLDVGVDFFKKNLSEWCRLESFPKSTNDSALFEDETFQKPIYNVWTFAKKTNEVAHKGNTEVRILDNLLYLYTKPFDIILDPFAGGGSTIDICKKRLRRYWVSDLNPIVEREHEIRKLDVVNDLPPLHKRWSEVKLTYLDPPYWRQVQGKYSNSEKDLANMSLIDFNEALSGIINRIADKQSSGHIALIIQPTQWNADNREFTDHIFDMLNLCNNKKLKLENRISCPYSTEQCNAQMVNWAKENKKLLVLTRELIIWKIVA